MTQSWFTDYFVADADIISFFTLIVSRHISQLTVYNRIIE